MIAEAYGLYLKLWLWLVAVQGDISLDVSRLLRTYAESGDWRVLAGFLPLAIVFGAAHALTPGHSKTVLAIFVAGSGANFWRGIGTAVTLAVTHISMSVLIVLFALPVISLTLGEAGRATVLEDLSRALIAVVGLWLLFSATRGGRHHPHGEGLTFGFVAGLIPCPLTLFAMTAASARGVPEAGIAFAAMMLIGVVGVLASVAAVAVAARAGLGGAIGRSAVLLSWFGRVALGATGLALVVVGARQVLG